MREGGGAGGIWGGGYQKKKIGLKGGGGQVKRNKGKGGVT